MAIKLNAPISFKFLLKRKSAISIEQTNPSNKSSIFFRLKGASAIFMSSLTLKDISGSKKGLLNFLDESSLGSILLYLENKLP